MTTVLSNLPLPKAGRFLRRPDFFGRTKSIDEVDVTLKYYDPEETETPTAADKEEADLRDFNTALRVLVDVFPHVEPQVFREMLLSLSKESRLQVVTEHLLRDGSKFIQGRYRKKDDKDKTSTAGSLSKNDTFRSEEYKKAVKLAFYQEFKSVSHSSVRAVLAEHNYSYTLARPTLQQIHSKSWRYTLTSLWSRKRASTTDAQAHPLIEWLPDLTGNGTVQPCLLRTKSLELNQEIYTAYIAPVLNARKEELLRQDQDLAHQLNETEAEEAQALFDCECCYTPTTFEQLSTCDHENHYICFRCIRHAVNEALFGQGWTRSIDTEKASLRCLAPALDECHGSIPSHLLQRALETQKDDDQTWEKLNERLSTEALIKSQLPLLRCPFCSYAETDELPDLRIRDPIAVIFQISHIPHDFWSILSLLALLTIYPILYPILPILILLILTLNNPISTRLRQSQSRILHKRRGLRFICQSPTCARPSCTNCLSPWQDPHTCHATTLQSLRQAIESATTASIKRVCPKCNLSFVKASGCNKLVCNCGYVMCYVCRQEIGAREGYAHFCQHFRERPGARCRECEKCDLYVAEDEDGVIRKAARRAEAEWMEKEALKTAGAGGSGGLQERDRARYGVVVKDVLRGRGGQAKRWDWDDVIDLVMEAVLA